MGAVAACVLVGCAQISAPTGGPKDDTPPVPVRIDPPSESVNIRPDRLVLQFDEFVALRSPQQQLVVSPPLGTAPEWRIRGKAVELTLDSGSFAPDRTYVFAFGGAIVDLHEANPAEDLKWAFSTGSTLDTLRVKGQVKDRTSGEPKGGLRVLLYRAETPWDSIWAGQRPDALGQTNKSGLFSLDYLSPGLYKGVAFDDVNGNYRWDDGEYVALDPGEFSAGAAELSWLGNETQEAKKPERIASCQADTAGMLRVFASTSDDSIERWSVLPMDPPEALQFERDGDSVMVWLQASEYVESMRLVWDHAAGSDTARVRLNTRGISGAFSPRVEPPIRSEPNAKRAWKFDRAVFVEDAERCIVYQDSVSVGFGSIAGSTDAQWTRSLSLELEEAFGAHYMLECLPGALRLQGTGVNKDTLMSVWATHPATHFGELAVTLTDVPGAGWFRLNEDRFYIQSDTALAFPLLPPGKVELGFEWDANRDSIWQSADPRALQAAEPYFCPAEQPEIRSNWVVEWNWSMAKNESEE